MKIGSLYLVKKLYWLLFPTAGPATISGRARVHADPTAAAYWSKQFEVTYFSPDSIVVFLEEDGEFKKVLTSDGRIGWTWLSENYNDSFEEVKEE